jgi:hypothetical protein
LVVVAHVVPEQPAKMLFVQGNDMVQDHVAVRGGFGKTRITARMERMNCGTNSPW